MQLDELVLPDIKRAFVPDPGYAILDCDEAGADAQVVAWEAGDEELKAAFRAGLDVHSHNAEAMLGTKFTSLSKDDPKRKKLRQENKVGVHLTNYGGSARAIAMTHGWLMKDAEAFQRRWFEMHPGILDWHRRVQKQLEATKSVSNAFGYRRIYTDRVDVLLPQALAWIPQSTVALVARDGMNNLHDLVWVRMNFQVHDSVVFQIPIDYLNPHRLRQIRKALTIVVPYPDQLIIPFGLSYSTKSWGDCKKYPWPEEVKTLQ